MFIICNLFVLVNRNVDNVGNCLLKSLSKSNLQNEVKKKKILFGYRYFLFEVCVARSCTIYVSLHDLYT